MDNKVYILVRKFEHNMVTATIFRLLLSLIMLKRAEFIKISPLFVTSSTLSQLACDHKLSVPNTFTSS